MNPHIVVINDLSNPMGGASLLALRSAKAFAARGFRVTFISGDSGPEAIAPEQAEPPIAYVTLRSDRLLSGNILRSFATGLYNNEAQKLIERWIASEDTPETIYHVHGWSQILSPSIFTALQPVWSRVVMTAHDFFLTCPNGAFFDFRKEEVCKREPLSLDCLRTNCDRRNYGHKLWRSARHAVQQRARGDQQWPVQLLIHHGMEEYARRAGLASDQLRVLPNPIVPFTSERVAAEKNGNVLFVGRLESTKGVDLAAAACRAVGAKLVAIGDGSLREQLVRDYPEMAFLGRMPSEQIGAVAKDCRMLVMPSRHMEPFGLTAVEALWSGLPVICSEVSLLSTDIEAIGAGLATDPTDITSFAACIERLASDDALVRQMSERAFACSGHLALRPDDWIDALLDIYAETLSRAMQQPFAPSARILPSVPAAKESEGSHL